MSVVRQSQANRPPLREADPTKDKQTEAKAPELSKRTKAEKTHEAKGYWQGVATGLLTGLIVALTFASLAFGIAGPILADYGARLDMTRAAAQAAGQR